MLSTLLVALLVASPIASATSQALEALRAEAKLPRTPSRCAPFETAALDALSHAGLAGKRLIPCVVQITTAGDPPLALLATKLEAIEVKLILDAGYLVEHPYAAATFSPDERAVRVPAALFDTFAVDDPVLEHELVHVAIWAAAHKDEANQLAYLHGEAFQPNDLALDEMRAYAQDLQRAATALKTTCKRADTKTWAAIWQTRQNDQPGRPGLEGCDLLFDRVAATVMFGRYHTDPALPALEALAVVSMAAEVTGDRTETILRGVATVADKSAPVELHLVRLAPKRNLDNNASVRALLAQTRAHQALWQKVGDAVTRLTQASTKELPSLLESLVKRAKPPAPAPKL